ncbi:MAG: hypothetical protein HYX63_01730 [Gammaproteobacteria bacterium]|nr:hypothetical protein [Gammaproteobacteria bacterium]
MPEYSLDPIDTLQLVRQRRAETFACLEENSNWKRWRWLWFPGIPGIRFEAWWMRQETLTLRLELPGDKFCVERSDECVAWWGSRRRTGIAYFAFIAVDESSYLRRPDRRVLTHRGYSGG